jgi:Holliday junction DNA helicase RuvA
MLAVHTPDALRVAFATADEKALTQVPGIGKKGAQRLLLELRDRLGAPEYGRAPAASTQPLTTSPAQQWRGDLHAALTGLGWTSREADQAIALVEPEAAAAERDGTPPDLAELLRAALRGLHRGPTRGGAHDTEPRA